MHALETASPVPTMVLCQVDTEANLPTWRSPGQVENVVAWLPVSLLSHT